MTSEDETIKAELDRYERARSSIGVGTLSPDKRNRERNATTAALTSLSGKFKSRSARPGRRAWGHK